MMSCAAAPGASVDLRHPDEGPPRRAHPGRAERRDLEKPLSYADIDELIGAFEEAGIDLEASEPPPRPDELARVLATARALDEETGKRPSVDEIAARSGLTPTTVRRALRLGRALGAPK